MVEGLQFWAMHQSFSMKEEAVHGYLQAHIQGTVEIVRGPNDSNAKYSPPEDAENLLID